MLGNVESALLILTVVGGAVAGNVLHYNRARRDSNRPTYEYTRLMRNTMATVLLLFAIPKLFDLRGFADIFARYDVIAGAAHTTYIYGYAYPFIEIALAAALLFAQRRRALRATYASIIGIMALSLAGVGRTLAAGRELRCGCLGSLLHIPLSYVTIAEGAVMLTMAAVLLRADLQKNVRFVITDSPKTQTRRLSVKERGATSPT